MAKSSLILVYIGIALLILMAGFHLSGIHYITSLVQESNTKPFLKEIFGVLFLHPSLHLFLLAALAVLSVKMGDQAWKVHWFIGFSALVDAVIAFYLQAIPPGILLLITAICFGWAGRKR